MIELLIPGALLAAVWSAVAIQRGWMGWRWLDSPAIGAALVILVGSVFGRDFFCVNIGPFPVTLDRVLWGVLMLLLIALAAARRIQLLPLSRLDVLVFCLAALLTLSTVTHDFRYRDNLPLTRLLFFNLMPLGLYLAARHGPVSERDLRRILMGAIVFAAYLAVTGIAEWRDWSALVFPRYIMGSTVVEFLGRARGPFLNPVPCGIFQIVGAIAAIGLWPSTGPRGRCVLGLLLVLFAAGIGVTFTRSVWVSFALCGGLSLWCLASIRLRGVYLAGAAVGGMLFVTMFASQFVSFKRDKFVTEAEMAESAQLRPLLAEIAVQMCLDRPVFGHGFGQYTKAKRLYHQANSTSPLKKVLPYMQHNVFLSYLTETGIVGGLLLSGLLAGFLAEIRRLWRISAAGSVQRATALVGLAVVVCYAVNGMFHDVSIIPMIGSLFYFFMGLTSHLARISPRIAAAAFPAQAESTTPARRLAS